MMVSPSVAADVKVEYFEGRHCRLRETAFQLLTINGTLPFNSLNCLGLKFRYSSTFSKLKVWVGDISRLGDSPGFCDQTVAILKLTFDRPLDAQTFSEWSENLSIRSVALVSAGLLAAGVIAVVAFSRGWIGDDIIANKKEKDSTVESAENAKSDAVSSKAKLKTRSLSEALGIPENEIANVGGIARPLRDLARNNASPKSPKNPLPSPGQLPSLKGDENAQVAGLFAEVQDLHGAPEARSAMYLPDDFDSEKYFENPQEYLNKIRAGRVFAPAQPAPGIQPIAAVSNRYSTILQGEKTVLRIKAAPNHPVVFYTPDGGEFDNRLKSISVAADKNGVAEVTYKAVPGTAGIIDILAASPLHSGQVKFTVKVLLPDS